MYANAQANSVENRATPTIRAFFPFPRSLLNPRFALIFYSLRSCCTTIAQSSTMLAHLPASSVQLVPTCAQLLPKRCATLANELHILRATIDSLRVRFSSIISVANNSASGRKHLHIPAFLAVSCICHIPAFLAVSCICLVYELRNLDQDSYQGLATLQVEIRVLTGSQQDRRVLHNICVESGKSGCLSRRIKSTSSDLV
jgi:hypothetical protein